jgi:hypothetical protein
MNLFLLYALLWAGFGFAWVMYEVTQADIRATREYKMALKRKAHGLKVGQYGYK